MPGVETDRAEAQVTRELVELCRQLKLRPPALEFASWQQAEQETLDRKRRRIQCLQKPIPEKGKLA